MKNKYTYSVESFSVGFNKWLRTIKGATRDFCLGYLLHSSFCSPRNAMRVVRSDGAVIAEHNAQSEVDIGMIAGWPSPEQYEAAAERALAQAKRIREQQKKMKL